MHFSFPGEHDEYQVYHADTDAYLFSAAARLGAHIVEDSSVMDMRRDQGAIQIETDKRWQCEVRYFVETGAEPSRASEMLGAAGRALESPVRDRLLFTQMANVKPESQQRGHSEKRAFRDTAFRETRHSETRVVGSLRKALDIS